jgi:hypothetical protein
MRAGGGCNGAGRKVGYRLDVDSVNTMQRAARFLILAVAAAAIGGALAYTGVVTRRVGGNAELLAALEHSIYEEGHGPWWVALALVAAFCVGSLVYVLTWRRK